MIVLTGVALLLLWIPLRQRVGIGTVLNAIEIGVVVDLVLAVVPETDAAALRWLYLAGGIGMIALGSGLYIGSGLGAGPRDGLMVGLNERFGWSIRVSRTVVEVAALAVRMGARWLRRRWHGGLRDQHRPARPHHPRLVPPATTKPNLVHVRSTHR